MNLKDRDSMQVESVVIDEKLLKQLYELLFDSLCKFLNYYTHDLALIEDTIQDVFVSLWEDRQTVDIFYVKTYLFNAARNKMLNHIRNKRVRSEILTHWATDEINKQQMRDCVDKKEFLQIYRNAIDALPAQCREIFILSREEELSYQQIALLKRISVNTVESQMSIALKKIKHFMLSHYRNNALFALLIASLFKIIHS